MEALVSRSQAVSETEVAVSSNDEVNGKMLGNPNADNPFATSDPFGPSRTAPLSDDFDNVDIGNNAPPTSSGLYSGPSSGKKTHLFASYAIACARYKQ